MPEIYQNSGQLAQAKGLLDQRDLIAAITRKLQRLNPPEADELGKLLSKRLWYPLAGLTILTGHDLTSPLEQDFLAHFSKALNVKLDQEQKAGPEASRKPINPNFTWQATCCHDLNQEVNWVFTRLAQQNLDSSQRVLCLIPDVYLYKDALKLNSLRNELQVGYDLPLYLTETNLGQTFLKMIKLGAGGWAQEIVMDLLAAPYFSEYQPGGSSWVLERLAALDPEQEAWFAFLEKAEGERKYPWSKVKKFMEMVDGYLGSFPRQACFGDYLSFLSNEVLPLFTIKRKKELLQNSFLQRDLLVWNKLGELLLELKFCWEALELGAEPIAAKEFYQNLLYIFQETEIREHKPANFQIVVKELNALIELENGSWDYLYVLGLAEGIWPRKRSNSWLFTEELGQSLRADGYAFKEQEEIDAEIWQSLKEVMLGREKHVFLSYPQSYQGKRLGPSRFLKELGLESSKYSIKLVREDKQNYAEKKGAGDNLEVTAKLAYKVTELNRYSYRPALYLYQEYWQLKAPFTTEQQERLLLGQLCHQVLESILAENKDLETALARTGEIIKKKNRDCSPWLLRVVEKKAVIYLSRWLKLHQNWLQELEAANSIVEVSFGLENSPYPALILERNGAKISIQGQIDRIDFDEQGRAVIYDYKLNTLPQMQNILQGKELQVPIYLLAFTRVIQSDNAEVLGGTYYSLKDNQTVTISKEKMEAKEWQNYLIFIEERIWQIVSGIANGDFTPRFGQNSCYYHCQYRKLCGRR